MLEVKVYINDVPMKYTLSEDATILGLKEMISFDTQDEPKYQQLKLYGSENILEDSRMVSSLGRSPWSGLFLQYSSSKAMIENRMMADEYYPELGFGINMLMMTIDVNGKPLKALLDTGAQVTIIKLKIVKQLGLENLIDRSYSRTLAGVGTGRTEGRIHLYNISINGKQYPVSMDVLDTDTLPEDMIFGLDNMVRCRAVIDIYNRTITLNGDNVAKLELMNNKKKRESPIDVFNNLQSTDPELIRQVSSGLGMSEQELETVFNDVCGGDISKFEQLFLR